jgi:hypothetical protein
VAKDKVADTDRVRNSVAEDDEGYVYKSKDINQNILNVNQQVGIFEYFSYYCFRKSMHLYVQEIIKDDFWL